MARVSLATIPVSKAGVASALTASTADGEIVDVGDNLMLVVNNKSASSVTVAVTTPLTVDGLAVSDVSLAVPAGSTGFVALDPRLFRRDSAPDAGRAYVNCTAPGATVLVGVVQR